MVFCAAARHRVSGVRNGECSPLCGCTALALKDEPCACIACGMSRDVSACRAGGAPDADAIGVGVAAWATRDGRLCLGELTPGGGGGRARGAHTLEPGRTLALLPGEAVLQVRTPLALNPAEHVFRVISYCRKVHRCRRS